MFALVETRIQKWSLGTEELKGEVDVAGVVREAIGGGTGIEDLEGVDLAVERYVSSRNDLVLANYRMTSSNSLVLLVSYASTGVEKDPGAMVVDQFSFGPRRVYVILQLVAHGDSWGVNGVTVVPYIAVSISCVAISRSRHIH